MARPSRRAGFVLAIAALLVLSATSLAVAFEPAGGAAAAGLVPGDPPVVASHINWFHFHYDHETQGPPLFFVFLNFGVVVWLLVHFGGPSLTQYLRQRRGEVARLIAEAREIKERAKAKLDEYERRLAGLEGELAAIVADLRGEAEGERKRLLGAAEEEAARLRRDAEQTIAAELGRMRAEIERELIDRVLGAAESILQKNLADTDEKRLFERYVGSLAPPSIKPPVRS